MSKLDCPICYPENHVECHCTYRCEDHRDVPFEKKEN